MPRSRPPYSPEYRQQMVDLVRGGRTPESLSREFEPTAQSIWNWVRQAERDEGTRTDGGLESVPKRPLSGSHAREFWPAGSWCSPPSPRSSCIPEMRRASKLPTTVEQHLTGSAGLSDCRQHQLAASGRDAAGLEIGPRIGTTRQSGGAMWHLGYPFLRIRGGMH